MLEKIDAVRKERNIESNNKAAIRDNAGFAESAGDNRIAKKSGVIKNQGELGGAALLLVLEESSVKDEARQDDNSEHDQEARQQTREKKVGSFFAVASRKSEKKRSRHEDRQ